MHVFADLVVFLDDDAGAAAAAARTGSTSWPGAEYTSDAAVFVGTPAGLADLLQDWQAAGLTGFRLRPAALPHDLPQITGGLVPELQRRGAVPHRLRGRAPCAACSACRAPPTATPTALSERTPP